MQRLASGPQLFRNEDSSRERSHWSLGMRPPASRPFPTLHGGWAFCGLRWGVSTSHWGYHITPYNALRGFTRRLPTLCWGAGLEGRQRG